MLDRDRFSHRKKWLKALKKQDAVIRKEATIGEARNGSSKIREVVPGDLDRRPNKKNNHRQKIIEFYRH